MLRFYFNVRSIHGIAEDYQGDEFPHVAAARMDAERYLCELLMDRIEKRRLIDIEAIDVCDREGQLLTSVSVFDVLRRADLAGETTEQFPNLRLVQPAAFNADDVEDAPSAAGQPSSVVPIRQEPIQGMAVRAAV